MSDETNPPDDESTREERLRSATVERVLAQLAKLLAAEREPQPPVVEWVTEPLPVEDAPGPPDGPVTAPTESAPAPEPLEVPAEPVPAEPVPAEPAPAEPAPAEPVPAEPTPAESVSAEPVPAEPVPAESWEVAKPGNNTGRPRQRPTPPLPLIKLPPAPPAPPAPPLCSTRTWNAMWLRLSIWPMVMPLLRASVRPDDEVAVRRTLIEAGFPLSIIRGYLPEVLADLRQRLASEA